MRITADTNVLARAITGDHVRQSKIAKAVLAEADLVAVTLPALCELVWVLSRGYKVPSADVAEAIRRLVNAGNVVVDRPAVDAGLAFLDAGADFADGVIAYEGRWLGGETFASFDVAATDLVEAQGGSIHLLS